MEQVMVEKLIDTAIDFNIYATYLLLIFLRQ